MPAKPLRLAPILALTVFAACVSGLVTVYLLHERTYYYWDFAGYLELAEQATDQFRISLKDGWREVAQSVSWEYNAYFTLPLVPIFLVTGGTRFVFVLSIALLYHLPLALAIGGVAVRLIPRDPTRVFWSTAAIALMIPVAWVPTLRGLPDSSAALCLALATYAALGDLRFTSYWRAAAVGLLVAGAVLLRRHFAYSGIALLAATTASAFLAATATGSVGSRLAAAARLAARFVVMGLVCAGTLVLLGWPMVLRMLTEDYRALHSAYERPALATAEYFARAFSWPVWILAVAGFVAGICSGTLERGPAAAVATIATASLALWIGLVRQTDEHYTLQLLPFIVLGLSALAWTARSTLRSVVGLAALLGLILWLVAGLAWGLGAIQIRDANPRYLPFARRPLVRWDYDEVRRLVEFLRSTSSPNEEVYVAASSVYLNDHLVARAEKDLFGRGNAHLAVLSSAHIDSRDPYPVEGILRATYVVVASPFLGHLESGQAVAEVVHDAFTRGWPVTRDFEPLPERFGLEPDLTVTVHRRVRTTSVEDALRFLMQVRERVGIRPGGQLDWLAVAGEIGGAVRSAGAAGFDLVADTRRGDAAFAYLERVGALSEVRIERVTADPACPGALLRVAGVDDQGGLLPGGEGVTVPSEPGPLTIRVANAASHLLLAVSSTRTGGPCRLVLSGVTLQAPPAGNRPS